MSITGEGAAGRARADPPPSRVPPVREGLREGEGLGQAQGQELQGMERQRVIGFLRRHFSLPQNYQDQEM